MLGIRCRRDCIIVIGNTHVARRKKLADGASDGHRDESPFEFSPRAGRRQGTREPQPPVESADQRGRRLHHFAALLDVLDGKEGIHPISERCRRPLDLAGRCVKVAGPKNLVPPLACAEVVEIVWSPQEHAIGFQVADLSRA
jgi:hypothetical protein